MIPESMYQALLVESKKIGVFGHGFTYGGHPVAAAVALKAIEIYARDRIVEKAAERGTQFQGRLKALGEHPLVGEARGLGLIGGLELVADKKSKRAFDAAHGVAARAVKFGEAEGLIVRAVMGDVLTLSPPLIISAAEVDDLFDRLSRALDNTLDWVTRERIADS
jgi:4-aminobutyrate--pyruvate transaminase